MGSHQAVTELARIRAPRWAVRGVAEADREPNGIRYTTREMFDELRRDIALLRDEIRTSRHDLAGQVATVALRVEKLEYQQADNLRRFQENDARAAKYIPVIEHLLTEDTMASQMKKAGWTRRERMLAYGLFLFAFVGAVGTVVSIIVLARGG